MHLSLTSFPCSSPSPISLTSVLLSYPLCPSLPHTRHASTSFSPLSSPSPSPSDPLPLSLRPPPLSPPPIPAPPPLPHTLSFPRTRHASPSFSPLASPSLPQTPSPRISTAIQPGSIKPSKRTQVTHTHVHATFLSLHLHSPFLYDSLSPFFH